MLLPSALARWPTSPHGRLLAIVSFVALTIFLYNFLLIDSTGSGVRSYDGYGPHAIDELIDRANTEYARVLAKKSKTLKQAAAKYRARRGRHPPPGFDAWFEYAKSRNALIIEDFFDPIYHDLEPFWGLPPKDIRVAAAGFEPNTLMVRNGGTEQKTDQDRVWMNLWGDLVHSIAETQPLPDMDLPINVMDEPRLLVPWEDINRLVTTAQAKRQMPPPSSVSNRFTGNRGVDGSKAPEIEWIKKEPEIWPLVSGACPPDSPARRERSGLDRSLAAKDYIPVQYPEASYHGYVSNWTAASDICLQPHLRGLHGTFIEPQSVRYAKRLIPIFGGSKLSTNNEILLPPAMYWSDNEIYSGGEQHGGAWEEKMGRFVWRGAGTGGRNRAETWPYFQRHRFVSMMNGSTVSDAEAHGGDSITFKLPSPGLYHVEAAEQHRLGEWVSQFSDAGFTDLLCFPHEGGPRCSYSDPYFEVAQALPMNLQYNYKYLPDIDGNSFSGRYRGFLRSTSVPIKATVYREWHDSRIFAWVHFIPMDNTFIDLYGIMEYFIGSRSRRRPSHDAVARRIAEEGQLWSEKVLRKEDMQIYVYRLLLEYARVSDDKRDSIGFVDDL